MNCTTCYAKLFLPASRESGECKMCREDDQNQPSMDDLRAEMEYERFVFDSVCPDPEPLFSTSPFSR